MRSFWDALPTEGRWLLSTVAVQTLGRGLTLPFTVIYLHEVRGFDLGLSGALMSLIAISGLVVTGPGGSLTDRYGARAILLGGLVAMIVGNVVLAFATTPSVAALALVLIGFNFGVSWPAFNALIAAVVTGDLRQRYFGVNFALVNLGIGVGGIVGGLYVDVSDPGTFTAIFLGDAASALIPMALLLGPLRHVHGRAEQPEEATGGTYREILRQPAVRWLSGVTFLGVFVGYGQFEAGFPGFARQVAEVSTRTIGVAFAVNTAVIVAVQFLVLSRISGRRRTRVMVVMGVVWAVAWLIVGAAGLVPGSAIAALGMLAFMGVFAFGETLMQPTIPAIANDLASDHTRGRYNAINAAAFQGGAISGPVVAGLLLEHQLAEVYIGLMVLGCLAICAMAGALERRIPATANGVTTEVPDVPASAAPPAATQEHLWVLQECYIRSMDVITQRELRNDNATIVSRVEAGESFTVTRRGRPVADLVPHASGPVRPVFVDAAEVVRGLADLPPVDADAWVRGAREVDELLDDADRDPWVVRG